MRRLPHAVALLVLAAVPAAASAAPPPNDARTAPRQLGALPATVPPARRPRARRRLRARAAIANDRRVRGSLHGSELDALDRYRFAIDRRSDLRIRLKTGADLDVLLLGENGHRGACG